MVSPLDDIDSRPGIPGAFGDTHRSTPTRQPRDPLSPNALLVVSSVLIDAGTMCVVIYLAALGRQFLPLFETDGVVITQLAGLIPALTIGWILAIAAVGGYRAAVFGHGADEYGRVVNGSLFAAALIGILCYLGKVPLSRGFFLLLFLIGVPALLVARYTSRVALKALRRHGALLQRVLLVGTVGTVDEIAEVLARESWLGYHVVGSLVPGDVEVRETTEGGVAVLGHVADAQAILATQADLVVFAGGGFGSARRMRSLAWELEDHNVQVVVAPTVTDVSSERLVLRPVAGLPLIHIGQPRSAEAGRWTKRAMDVVGSTALLVLLAPLLVVAAMSIKLYDGGPVFFRQRRVGRDGEEFDCLKLRTMVVDAEQVLRDLHAERGGVPLLFKDSDDPRITPPGRWLRRYSIDELPQLSNVLRGEMSLVGPRPALVPEVALYNDDMRRRLRVRPGMTGLWQVSGRSDLSVKDATRLDLFYVDNWSMVQDLIILVRTLRAVLGGRGAY